MDVVGGTVKSIIFRKVKSGFVTIDSPFEFHQAILKVAPSSKSVYLPNTDVLNEPENIEQESKKIPETLKVHHVERFEVKRVYGLKFFLPSRGWATFLYPMVFKREGYCHLRARNCRCWWQPLCFVPWRVSAKKRRVDAVSGIVSAVVSRTVLFQLVYYLDCFY